MALLLVAGGLPSCGGLINLPAPVLTSLSPSSTTAGQPSFMLTLNGNNFVSNSSVVEWNGSPRTTFFLSSRQITATILATDINNPGTATVTVVTPAPGGGTSAPQTFTITPTTSPIPQVTSISPSGALAGGSSFTLLITGNNFVSQSEVAVNGNNRATAFRNTTLLQAAIPSTDLNSAGTLSISVVNPPPGGGASNAVPLEVINPVPKITSLAPTSVAAGSTPTTLTVTGAGFVTVSVILINGSARITSFTNSSTLTAPLTAGDLAAAGVYQVQVMNPAPGGGTSSIQTFAVDPTQSAGLPVLVDLAPDGSQANNGICSPNCSSGTPNLNTAGPAIDKDGRFVAYASISNNLVANDNNAASDVFLRDTCFAQSSCTPVTTFVSIGAGNIPANGPSFEPSLDSSGGHAAFTSLATNLDATVPVSGGKRQVYWRATCTAQTGCGTPTTSLVSVSADGLSAGNGDSFNPSISPDGRYVAFVSLATNLVTSVTPDGVTPQVYLRDTCGGTAATASGVTVALGGAASGTTATDSSGNYTFGGLANGAYTITPSKPGDTFTPPSQSVTVNGANVTGVNFAASVITTGFTISGTISPTSGGVGATLTLSGSASATTTTNAFGNFAFTNLSNGSYTITPSKAGFSFTPSSQAVTISGGNVTSVDFTVVALASSLSGTISPAAGGVAATVTLSGAASATATTDSSGQYTFGGLPNGTYTVTPSNAGYTFAPSNQMETINGANVTGVNFTATAITTGVAISGTIGPGTSSCVPTTRLISTPDGTTPANGPSGNPAVANNGLFVAFSSAATNLGTASGGVQQVFVRKTCVNTPSGCTASTTLVSSPDASSTPTNPANSASIQPSVTSDGRFIAFASTATNLGTASGSVQQIYVRDTCVGVSSGCTPSIHLISTTDGTTPGNALSEHPSISETGEFVGFASLASNFSGDTLNGIENIFVRNTCTGSTTTCSASTALASVPAGTSPPAANGNSLVPSISGDGHTVAFLSFANNLVARDTNNVEDIFLAATTF